MKKEVSHKGRVVEVGQDVIQVEIISSSACSSCHAAGLCTMSEAVKKIVEVPAASNPKCYVGEEVELVLQEATGMKAVLLAYVIPLLILLILCVSLSYVNMNELYAGFAGLAGVLVYYLALYLVRNRISGDYVFRIRK